MSPEAGGRRRALVRALGCPCPPLLAAPKCLPLSVTRGPARGQVSAWPARPAPCRVCALKIGSGSGAAALGATGGLARAGQRRGDLRPGSGPRALRQAGGVTVKGVCGPACERPKGSARPNGHAEECSRGEG